jgi:hypothetical protein
MNVNLEQVETAKYIIKTLKEVISYMKVSNEPITIENLIERLEKSIHIDYQIISESQNNLDINMF